MPCRSATCQIVSPGSADDLGAVEVKRIGSHSERHPAAGPPDRGKVRSDATDRQILAEMLQHHLDRVHRGLPQAADRGVAS